MRRLVWILNLAAAACGGSSAQPAAPGAPVTEQQDVGRSEGSADRSAADVPYSLTEPPQPTSGTATQEEQWWLTASCPPGSERFGAAPPAGLEIGCRTPKGKLEGRYVKFHESGKKAEEGEYANNLAVGIWTSWTADGQKQMETTYHDGAKHGLETEWYPGGTIKSQREYRAGKREGTSTIWDEAGRKRTAMTYKNAKPHGREVRWDETGRVAKIIDHGSP